MLVVTAAQMREIDRLTIHKYGVPSLTLMERAGEAVTRTILTRFAPNAKKGVLVIAGKGNNGGDGLAVARLLQKNAFLAKWRCSRANTSYPTTPGTIYALI